MCGKRMYSLQNWKYLFPGTLEKKFAYPTIEQLSRDPKVINKKR